MKDFVPYEQALDLKELEFNEPCIQQYSYDGAIMFCVNSWGQPRFKTNRESLSDSDGDCISAPTFSQAFRWFREKYKLIVYIQYYAEWNFEIFRIGELAEPIDDVNVDYTFKGGTYEEAELECLRKLIKIVKEQK